MIKAAISRDSHAESTQVKIFVFPKSKNKMSFLGKGKNIFGDGVKFQRNIRKEWQ